MGLLLNTLKGNANPRPAIWFMRQAGRILPNYLKLRESYSFHQLMEDPKLCSEVTLMPLEDLGVDSAILFSDILVVPEAMGMSLEFTDKGPVFSNSIASGNKVENLLVDHSKFDYILNNIRQIKEDKKEENDLIGFCGAPLTTLLYMIQGFSSNHTFDQAIKFIYARREETKLLIEKITEASIYYATEQIKAGIDAFQLFDTHAGIIPFELYKELFEDSIMRISKAVRAKGTPFIYFPKGVGIGIKEFDHSICDAISIDWQTPLAEARKLVDSKVILQGNLDPRIFYADEAHIASKLNEYKEYWQQNKNFIFNLGHGFMPGIDYKKVQFAVQYIKENF